MSADIERINGLLTIVREASGHPTKLSGLVALAMRELEDAAAKAREELNKILAKEKEEADAKQLEEFNKRQAAAKKEEEEAEVKAKDTRPTPSWESPIRRREETTNG